MDISQPAAQSAILRLPPELLDVILGSVSRHSLIQLSIVCRRFRDVAAARIWHTVEITDRCSQRRDAEKHGYNATVAPEQDPDADVVPGSPIRWNADAQHNDNPRRARLMARVPVNHNDPVPAPIDLERNPLHPREIMEDLRRQRDARYSEIDPCTNAIGLDHHDDTPAIHKLYILASRPELAKHVRVLWHRCHLVTPDMSTELLWMCCSGQTLSSDWRTLLLLRLAIRNMVNVTTLKFAMPHWNMYWTLMCDFMDRDRPREQPVSRLWLETCSAIQDAELWPSRCDFSTIKSIRIRRLKLGEDTTTYGKARGVLYPAFYLSRTGPPVRMRNGHGGMFYTSTHTVAQEESCRPKFQEGLGKVVPAMNTTSNCRTARAFDDIVYEQMPGISKFLLDKQTDAQSLPPLHDQLSHLGAPNEYHKGRRMIRWLKKSFEHLTNLNLDWVVLRKSLRYVDDAIASVTTHAGEALFFSDLSKLRIRTLRSFQLRNALSQNSALPPDVFLLTPKVFCMDSTGDDVHHIDFLSFLEYHQDLTCIAWPMDAFLDDKLWLDWRPTTAREFELAQHGSRVRSVVQRLGTMLETLRVDCMFQYKGEPQSEILDEDDFERRESCRRRRLFISYVAPHMQKVATLKIEGHVARAEKRELLQAMRHCPLQHFVSIGRTFPLGNTWGLDAETLEEFEGEAFSNHFVDNFEAEELSSLDSLETLSLATGHTGQVHSVSSALDSSLQLEPRWTWLPAEPPLLYTVANFFADTITELKFCGSSSSIIYGQRYMGTDNITSMILCHLKHFHNLQNLIISYYSTRDVRFTEEDVILTWLCERDALWQGKDESFADEEPNDETDEIDWSDLFDDNAGYEIENYPGQVDRVKLQELIHRYKDNKLIQHVLRRAFLWDKHWSIQSSISPFCNYLDLDPYYEELTLTTPKAHLIPFGRNDSPRAGRNEFGAYVHDPIDRSKMIIMPHVAPFAEGAGYPAPSDIFAPFRNSHYFTQWHNSLFLIELMEDNQIVFFWKHIAASLQLLRYRFSPIRMAEEICTEMSAYLSPRALATPSGLKLRASFCLGMEANDIFDLDILMDDRGVRRFWGPRPEADMGRWREKNDARRYF